jgi:hypothetical protein
MVTVLVGTHSNPVRPPVFEPAFLPSSKKCMHNLKRKGLTQDTGLSLALASVHSMIAAVQLLETGA